MFGKRIFVLIAAMLGLLAFCPEAAAQFRSEAFSQNYSNDPSGDDSEEAVRDSSFTLSFGEFFRGLSGKGTSRMGNTFFASTIFIGGQQIYNKDYWKLPIVYGGIGAGVGMGFKFRNDYLKSVEAGVPDTRAKTMQTLMFAGAGAVYWGALMDGMLCYETDIEHSPTRAALLSLLVPGLGQCYNKEYWKIPIYWGIMIGGLHYLNDNSVKYNKYRNLYIQASDPDSGYTGRIPAETAKYYRDMYREWRDYSILVIAGGYLLQVIDANVFAYMLDFEVSDDLSMKIEPAVIAPDTRFAFNPGGLGLKLGITF